MNFVVLTAIREIPSLSGVRSTAFALCCCLAISVCAQAQSDARFPPKVDPAELATIVRDTQPNSARTELQHLFAPPGFEVRLVASEPEIAKPMNLAFDQRGRLWVSHSVEYPVAAKDGAVHRDRISVIDDTDDDGVPDRVTTFAEGLNIPIGICPYGDGVICFSIPNILYLRDTDQDGRADQREIVYGPFDTSRDTHGMCNAFRRGTDGWIYACHGFNNQSTVAGRDGHQITMKSGNVFRFRPDGSRIEHFTYGQVNPFGMAIDQFGDIFTADCHTKPVSLLLKGGCYDSFGRPHDGLGYVPAVMDHLHGSTAIGGIALAQSGMFPAEYQNNSFGGNVMTSRVNRNKLVRVGASVRAVEQPDFLISTDPWFRPVDLVFGPDGALYVADFYNRIIGHYEVPLDHPGRDRTRGRIWRISWEGDASPSEKARSALPDLVGLDRDALIKLLSVSDEVRGRMVMDAIADRNDNGFVPELRTIVTSSGSATARRRAVRLLQRIEALDVASLQSAVHDDEPLVRVHAFRALAEVTQKQFAAWSVDRKQPDILTRALLVHGLEDPDPMVRRVAALAAAEHPAAQLIRPLMDTFHQTPSDDVHLRHSLRMTLRTHLQNDHWFTTVLSDLSDEDVVMLGTICPALNSTVAADFVVRHLDFYSQKMPGEVTGLIEFAAPLASQESIRRLVAEIRRNHRDDTHAQIELLWPIVTSSRQGGSDLPHDVVTWASDLACELLEIESPDAGEVIEIRPRVRWHYVPHATARNADNCWTVSTRRRCADGVSGAELFSSFEAGESRTGIQRSEQFVIPATLSFFIAGHAGFPKEKPHKKNLVRLIDVESGDVIQEAFPPRNDVAHRTEWDLRDFKGRTGVLELVDGDSAGAFAWLAVGRFSMDSLNPDLSLRKHTRAAEIIAICGLREFRPVLNRLLRDGNLDRERRSVFATAVSELSNDAILKALSTVVTAESIPESLAATAAGVIAQQSNAETETVLVDACRHATSVVQKSILSQLCVSSEGAGIALRLLESGSASTQCLFDPALRAKLEAILPSDQQPRLSQLLQGLPAEDTHLAELIASSKAHVTSHPGDAEQGQTVFRKHCSTCHQIKGEGKRIGPNLDGIGNRGFERLLEDILAPSRNVDVAFRASTIVLQDGRVLAGLVQDADNGVKLINSRGDATEVRLNEIEERIDSRLSPMPANVTELITPDEFSDLVSYLLSQRH